MAYQDGEVHKQEHHQAEEAFQGEEVGVAFQVLVEQEALSSLVPVAEAAFPLVSAQTGVALGNPVAVAYRQTEVAAVEVDPDPLEELDQDKQEEASGQVDVRRGRHQPVEPLLQGKS